MKLLVLTQAIDIDDPALGFFHSWVAEFAKHFESIIVICLKEGAHTLPSNVRVHSLGKEGGHASRIVYALRFLRLIWKLRCEYDAVFVHMNPEYVVLGGIFWRLTGKRTALWYTHKQVNLRLRIAVVLAGIVLTASKESFRLASRKARVLGHGIDIDDFPVTPRSSNLRIITIGRITASKRLVEMFSVLDELERRSVEFSFDIVGAPATENDFAYLAHLQAEVARRSYAAKVRMLGAVPHSRLSGALDGASVFLHMSKTGSLDKAVLESLASGIPVVSTSEAFLEAPVIQTSDDPVKIADAIVSAEKADPNKLRSYVQKNHSLSRLIGAILAEYEAHA